jgi:hypothetical protein
MKVNFLVIDKQINILNYHLVIVKWFFPIVSVNKLGLDDNPLISMSIIFLANSSYSKVPDPFVSYLSNNALISLSLNTHPNLSNPCLNYFNYTRPLSFRSKYANAFLAVFHSFVLPEDFSLIF